MPLQTADRFLTRLQQGDSVIADSAIGTELIKRGVALERMVHANREYPEAVADLYRASLAAGVDALTTNTFGLPAGREWYEDFYQGVEIAIRFARAQSKDVAVFVSLYPAEALLFEEGEFVRLEEIAGDCILLLETATEMSEALAALKRLHTNRFTQTAVTCHFTERGVMPDGTTPEQAARLFTQAGAILVGGNCGERPEDFLPVVQQMRSVTNLPLLFQPNAGLPTLEDGVWNYPITPASFADTALRLYEAGAQVLGGCCGTTPAHITEVRRLLSHTQRRAWPD